jgi:hypothetical protein
LRCQRSSLIALVGGLVSFVVSVGLAAQGFTEKHVHGGGSGPVSPPTEGVEPPLNFGLQADVQNASIRHRSFYACMNTNGHM